jgi:hypothetical protein
VSAGNDNGGSMGKDAIVSGKEKAGHFGAPKPAIFWTTPKT